MNEACEELEQFAASQSKFGISLLTKRYPCLTTTYSKFLGAHVIVGKTGYVAVIRNYWQFVLNKKPYVSYPFNPSNVTQLAGAIMATQLLPTKRTRPVVDKYPGIPLDMEAANAPQSTAGSIADNDAR